MNRIQKKTVTAAASHSQTAADLIHSSLKQKTMKKKQASLTKRLRLKPVGLYHFDNAYDNLEVLMTHFFGKTKKEIEVSAAELRTKFRIGFDDFDKFTRLLCKGKFNNWLKEYEQYAEGDLEVASAVLSLYFQMLMVPSPDIHTDMLSHAYVEDLQPFLI